VRHAQPDDWPAVADLLTELRRGVARGTADDTTHRLQFAGHIRQIEHVTLVAENGGDVLGVIDMEYHQRLGDHRPQARVNDLVVTERTRGGGIGTALLSRAEELA
jgi:GNAT superfamily N-acetyltransferase